MSDDSIALFLDTECMTFFKEWDIDIVHATFFLFGKKTITSAQFYNLKIELMSTKWQRLFLILKRQV